MSLETGYIDDSAGLSKLCQRMRKHPIIAVDMESNGMFCYPEFICLIQVGIDGEQYLVDPIAVSDLTELVDIFRSPEYTILLHSGSYDVSSFKRDYDCTFGKLFDTAIGAAFIGYDHLGLDNVAKDTIGVDLPKSKQLQRSNWTIRPLSREQIDYARVDVEYLHDIHTFLVAELTRLNRLAWVEEENEIMAATPYRQPLPPEENYARAKYVNRLSPQARAVFKELFVFRDREALRRGVPPFRILQNDLLLKIAEVSAETGRITNSHLRIPARYLDAVAETVNRGLRQEPCYPEDRAPSPDRLMSKRQRGILKKLKQWRGRVADDLGLAPNLVWPASHLGLLACCKDREDAVSSFHEDDSVRQWQKQEFGDQLLSFAVESFLC